MTDLEKLKELKHILRLQLLWYQRKQLDGIGIDVLYDLVKDQFEHLTRSDLILILETLSN